MQIRMDLSRRKAILSYVFYSVGLKYLGNLVANSFTDLDGFNLYSLLDGVRIRFNLGY
jgi:hypothetical protein